MRRWTRVNRHSVLAVVAAGACLGVIETIGLSGNMQQPAATTTPTTTTLPVTYPEGYVVETTTSTTQPHVIVPRPERASSRGRASRGLSGNALLDCINKNEGSPGYGHNDGDRYDGRYQFDQGTWDGAVSRAGHGEWAGRSPSEAPAEIQDAAAMQLYRERGLQPWSRSARRNCQ